MIEIGGRYGLVRDIYNDIQFRACGVKANGTKGADCERFEVKGKNVESSSPVTLGGLKEATMEELVQYVYNKIKVVLFVEFYVSMQEGFYEVVNMSLLSGLTEEKMRYGGWYPEPHGGTTNLRMSKKRLLAMYEKIEKVERVE